MGTIHFFNGQDGGVGKSTTTKITADYCIERGIPIKLFDADRKEDVYRVYHGKYPIQKAIFNEGEEYQNSANALYDEAIAHDLLVNLPANVFHSLVDWFEKNGIFEMAEDLGISFVNWFVTDGDPDKIANLQQNLAFFGNIARHNILVQNYGKRKDWANFNDSKIVKKLSKKYSLTVLKLPKLLGNSEKDLISREFLTFTEARNYPGFSSSISQSRIRSFVRASFQMLDLSGIFALTNTEEDTTLQSNACFTPTPNSGAINPKTQAATDSSLVPVASTSTPELATAELNGKCHHNSASIDLSPEKNH